MKKKLFLVETLFLFLYLTLFPKLTPAFALSDLVSTGFQTCWEAYDDLGNQKWKAWTWVKVKNQGLTDSGAFKVYVGYTRPVCGEFWEDPTIDGTINFTSVPAGETVTAQAWLLPNTTTNPYVCWDANDLSGVLNSGYARRECRGSTVAKVIVDSDQQVDETDEDNNGSCPTFSAWPNSLVPGYPGISCSTGGTDNCAIACIGLGWDGRTCRETACGVNELDAGDGLCSGGRNCCCYGAPPATPTPTPTRAPTPTPTRVPTPTPTTVPPTCDSYGTWICQANDGSWTRTVYDGCVRPAGSCAASKGHWYRSVYWSDDASLCCVEDKCDTLCTVSPTPTPTSPNSPPVCDSIIGSSSVSVSSSNQYSASVTDANPGDTLTYLWSVSADCGSFSNRRVNPVTWAAPATPKTCTLSMVVEDGHGGSDTCPEKEVEVVSQSAWFQTKDGYIHAQGRLKSLLPAGEYLSENGSGGDPGVVFWETGTPELNNGEISTTNWQVTPITDLSSYSYNYFNNLVSQDDGDPALTGKPASGIYKLSGNKTITGTWSVGASDEITIFVDGNLTINTNITVANNGFLGILASGDINISSNVVTLQGFFLAGNQIKTSGNNDTTLSAQGIFIGVGGFALEREPVDPAVSLTSPAESFTFRPDIYINTPPELESPRHVWDEIEP